MSLKVDLVANEEKLRVVSELLDDLRARRGRDDPHYIALKAVVHDIKGRIELPRNNVLGEIERALQRTRESQVQNSYSTGQLSQVAYLVMKFWPVIRQALEQFGELSAE